MLESVDGDARARENICRSAPCLSRKPCAFFLINPSKEFTRRPVCINAETKNDYEALRRSFALTNTIPKLCSGL